MATNITDVVKEWFAYIDQCFMPRTVQHYKMVLKRFCVYISLDLVEITPHHIKKYLDMFLITQKVKQRTFNAHLTVIKSFFRWYADRYYGLNVAKPIKMLKEAPPHQRVITEVEYKRILAVAIGIERDTIQFLANTGIRRSEFCSLTWENIIGDYLHVFGKGKHRIVPLNPLCQEILTKYNGQKTIGLIEKYKSRESLYWLCTKLNRRLSPPLERFGPHAFRHFFCTRLVEAGVPLIKVSMILGHSSILTTQKVYCHILPQDLLGVTDCLQI